MSEAYRRGDLNGDGQNNHADFVLFKRNFEQVNGNGSFARMLVQTPEPNGLVLVLLGVVMQAAVSRNRCSSEPVGDPHARRYDRARRFRSLSVVAGR